MAGGLTASVDIPYRVTPGERRSPLLTGAHAMIHVLQTTDPLFLTDPFSPSLLPAVSESLFLLLTAVALIVSLALTYRAARGSYRRWHGWIVIGLAAVVCLAQISLLNVIVDDAFITFRHAENWARGSGLTWNPGERIEGTSSLLWTFILGLAAKAGLSVPLTAHFLGLVCCLLCLVVIERLAAQLVRRRWLTPLAAFALALNPYFAVHVASGLETGLFVLLIGVAYWSLLAGRLAWASILLALATMTRPDGAVFWFVAVVYQVTLRPEHRQRVTRVLVTPFLILVGATELWRVAYFGDLLPNSVRAKAGLSLSTLAGGVRYVWAFVDVHGLIPLSALIGAAVWLRRHEQDESRPALLLIGGAATYMGAVLLAGGDWMPAFRYLVPVVFLLVPLLVFAVEETAEGLGRLVSSTHPGRVKVAITCLVLLLPATWMLDSIERVRPAWAFANLPRLRGTLPPVLQSWRSREQDLAQLGLWMRKSLPAGLWLASLSSGALPYYSQFPTIDMRGLSDRHIARVRPRPGMPGHRRQDDPYVFARTPDVLYVENGFGDSPPRLARVSPLEQVPPPTFSDQYDTVFLEIVMKTSPITGAPTRSRWARFFLLRRDRALIERLLGSDTRLVRSLQIPLTD
jgi:arabinofuranosyltransferase